MFITPGIIFKTLHMFIPLLTNMKRGGEGTKSLNVYHPFPLNFS